MQYSPPSIKVRIEKTSKAKELEKKLGVSFAPKPANITDAGMDVRACLEWTQILVPGAYVAIPIGIKCELSEPNWEIQLRMRSGLAAKYGLMLTNGIGTIDYLYRQEIQALIYNAGQQAVDIKPGDRIGQLCIRPIPIVEVEEVEEISTTNRGGFGSTGVQ